jgi:outer membrane protein TolC
LIPLLLGSALQAATMQQLFEGLKGHYQTQLGELEVRRSVNALELVKAQLYPTIRLFGSTTHYNSPSNLRPVTPTENADLAKTTLDYPFSQNIARIGATLSMPLYVASLYTLAEQAAVMQRSAREKKQIDLLKNEATLVGANANLRYLEELRQALHRKRKTLRTTEKIVRYKVESGRAPRSALLKVRERLEQIEIAINSLEIQRENVRALIENLSGIELSRAVPMRKGGTLRKGELAPLRPLREKAEADRLAIDAQRQKLYPSLHLNADISRGYGESYASGRNVQRDYGGIGVTLTVPLVDLPTYRGIEKARLAHQKSQTQLAQSAEELRTRARSRSRQLRLLRRSLTLHRRSIAHQEELLKMAQASYRKGRMTLEEYLRYVDALFDARAQYYQSKAQYWQTLAELAFLYGNDLQKLVR